MDHSSSCFAAEHMQTTVILRNTTVVCMTRDTHVVFVVFRSTVLDMQQSHHISHNKPYCHCHKYVYTACISLTYPAKVQGICKLQTGNPLLLTEPDSASRNRELSTTVIFIRAPTKGLRLPLHDAFCLPSCLSGRRAQSTSFVLT